MINFNHIIHSKTLWNTSTVEKKHFIPEVRQKDTNSIHIDLQEIITRIYT